MAHTHLNHRARGHVTHQQPVDLLLVIVEYEAKVNGDDGAVAEQERRVTDLANQALDLAQDGESTQVGCQAGQFVIAGNQGIIL